MKRTSSIFIDIVLISYFTGCAIFLINQITAWNTFLIPGISFTLATMLIMQFLNDSIGLRIIENKVLLKQKFFSTISGWFIMILLLVTLIVGWIIVEVNIPDFLMGMKNTKGIVSGLFSPNLKNLIPMLSALAETIYLALLATVFAIPFAFIFSFLAARNLMPNSFTGNLIYIVVRTLATFSRSVEAVIWAIIFCVWVGIGPFAGMLALLVHSIAALTKLYSEQIENIDPGPVEAIKGTGASTLQIWLYAVIPQIISPYLAFTIYRWDINVRMATIVGFVGGGGIGLALQQEQQLLRWHNVGLIIWLIAIVIWIMDMISGKIRARLMEI
jgi:phosphonate transport system permease protein